MSFSQLFLFSKFDTEFDDYFLHNCNVYSELANEHCNMVTKSQVCLQYADLWLLTQDDCPSLCFTAGIVFELFH